ncbi:hypothetical protein J6590_019658 [Homalodisca vitripennis]|nr:hypothetical protein J6590_019658 [Homalodisca vitripennis]
MELRAHALELSVRGQVNRAEVRLITATARHGSVTSGLLEEDVSIYSRRGEEEVSCGRVGGRVVSSYRDAVRGEVRNAGLAECRVPEECRADAVQCSDSLRPATVRGAATHAIARRARALQGIYSPDV